MSGTPHYTLVGYADNMPEREYGFVLPVYEHEGEYYRQKLTSNYKAIEDFKPLDEKTAGSVTLFAEQKKDIIVRWYDKPTYAYRAGDEVVYGRPADKKFEAKLKEIRGGMPWRSIDKEDINRFLKTKRSYT